VRIVRLDPSHAGLVRALRLRAVREEPTAFLSSYEEDVVGWTEDFVATSLSKPLGTGVFGAFAESLVGMVGLVRETRMKSRHRARIWGMYVAPESRARGIARTLLEHAIAEARAAGIEHLELTVAAPQSVARALYERLGFRSIGTIPSAMRVNGKDVDEALMVLTL
jgi:ribosomal protein S18 acetylase RimI-like enzyme